MKTEKKFYHMKQAFGQTELHAREAVCTRLEPPQCMARCPIRLDARALCDAVSTGDFKKGLAVMRAATPFVRLIAMACDAPCQNACVLAEGPGAIQINALERACIRYGEQSRPRFLLPRKTASPAVVGDDLFALAAAIELGLKGYRVDFYTNRDDLTEILTDCGLGAESAAADLSVMDSLKITRKRIEVPMENLIDSLANESAAVCVSAQFVAGLQLSGNIFTGEHDSRIANALCSAKSAALSADRRMQGVQTEAGRQREGSFESTLYVSPDDIASAGSISLRNGVDIGAEDAVSEGARCIQCSCEECIRGCAFLQHYKSDPRRTIREVYNNLSIVMGDHMANTMTNSCALCDQCSVTCPFGFDVREVCLTARRTMVETGKMPPSAHEFALLDMEFSGGEAFLARTPPGTEKCEYVFFPGCQASAVSPGTVNAVYADISARLEGGVGLMLGCCGAIAEWAGRRQLFEETLDKILESWEQMGRPKVITACPNCMKLLGENTDMEIIGVWDVLSEIGLPDTAKGAGRSIIVRDACGARGDAATQDSVRSILSEAGYTVQEADYSRDRSPCCGWGGLVSFVNPTLAGEMARFDSEVPGTYVTYCMACRDRLTREGRDGGHMLELLYNVEPEPTPDLSARRYNRMNLKNNLLREIWGESVNEEKREFNLYIGEEVRALMEDRMILEGDIYEVMRRLRQEDCAVLDKATGYMHTCCRIGNVTFWVSYTEMPDGYEIRNAYSHRMSVEAV